MSDTIPLHQLASYPALLSHSSTEPGLLLNNPLSDLSSLRGLERFTPEHRAELSAALIDDLQRWDAPQAARAAAGELGDATAYAVVTGQQAGVATGPLYTLYKGVGAVLAAQQLAQLHPGNRFVPLFWIEGDDHDFDEARRLVVLNRTGDPVALRYDDGIDRPLHVGDRKVNAEGLARLIEELRESLLPTEFTDAALGIVNAAYGGSEATLADGFARAMYAILGDTPLVIASSRNSRLKRLAADIFAAELRAPNALYEAVAARTEKLKGDGFQTPIAPKVGSLFITHEGERRALDYSDGGYSIRGTDRRFDTTEAIALAHQTPELLSPNVVLRPIVQDAIFPTAIYFGGPSEVAYLNQLRDGYRVFGLEAPAIAPRPFVMLLEPKVRRVLEVLNIGMETLLAEKFDAAALLIDEAVDAELEKARGATVAMLSEAYRQMAEVTTKIDPTLEKTLGAAEAGATKAVEDFAKRLRSALKKKQGTEIEKLGMVRQMVMPGDHLQERELNALYYINKYGVVRFREVLGQIVLCPGEMQVIEV
jgi:bacillithiol biosynthesis cysteine-adding enzyme BshC